MKKQQITFEFFGNEQENDNTSETAHHTDDALAAQTLPETTDTGQALTPFRMRQAALKWLAKQNPCGIGTKVATRISKYQVDVAAFWSLPAGARRRVEKTVLVEIRNNRDHCWPDCSNREAILKKIRDLKAERTALEKLIRQDEPELKASDTLFEEYECWDYEKSRNPQYHDCLAKLEELQHSLYKGSRLELIRQSQTADFIYVALPEGTIHADELIDGIGLLAIKDDLEIVEIKPPDALICNAQNRNHIVQNIAVACRKSLLFANGVNLSNDRIFITNPPRRRRK
ncbi:MAG: hypothetical protein PHV82_02695 [Victivallaceae bacterium]|nr:hypothetical protein [Victivallaceae bacterium]